MVILVMTVLLMGDDDDDDDDGLDDDDLYDDDDDDDGGNDDNDATTTKVFPLTGIMQKGPALPRTVSAGRQQPFCWGARELYTKGWAGGTTSLLHWIISSQGLVESHDKYWWYSYYPTVHTPPTTRPRSEFRRGEE